LTTTLLYYLLLICIPLNLYAEEAEFHTLQTGSFLELKDAQKQFEVIAKKLHEHDGFMRIEKIGKIYALRIGAFKDYSAADQFLQTHKTLLKRAIILKVRISEDRIIQRYPEDSAGRDMTPQEIPVPQSGPDTLTGEHAVQQRSAESGPNPPVPESVVVSEDPASAESQDTPSIEQPVPADVAAASVPVTIAVSDAGTNKSLKDEQSPQMPSSAGNAGILSNVKGRFYVSDYYSNDSDDFKYHVLESRLNVYKHEVKDSRYYYTLDARVRKKIFNGDMEENVPEWKVDEAWLGIKFPKLKLDAIGGRQNIYELYNTTIDGLNVKYTADSGLGLGIFGGLAPDKEDESLNTDFKSIGGYVFLNQEKHKVQFGYENLTYKGETDREYFSLRIYSKFHEKMRFNAVSSASINQMTEDFEVENANANLQYAHSRKLRFNIFYNYFRSIKFYESTREYLLLPDVQKSFFIDDNSRMQTGLRVDYKLMKGLKIYSSAAYERRKEDGEDKLRLTGGFRKYDLYGFDVSGRYTYIDDFDASSDEFNAEITRNFFNRVDLSVYASREEKKLDLENAYTTRALTYGSSIYWMISRNYFMTSFLESYEKDDDRDEEENKDVTTSVFTQMGYKF
jgi:hypothetical protein